MKQSGNESALLPPALSIEMSLNETFWKCHLCLSYFYSRKCLKKHLGEERHCDNSEYNNPYSKVHQIKFSCKTCNRSFDTSQGLNQHLGKKHREEKQSVCVYCNKSFTHKYAVKFHINQVHKQSTRVICKYCPRLFYNIYVMKQHSKKCKFRFPSN